MATPVSAVTASEFPPAIASGCDLVQTLIKLQRAAHLITSTLDLGTLLERVARDVAISIGGVKVAVWLRDVKAGDMVLKGIQGCSYMEKGARLKIGEQGMVGHVAATGAMRYARDVSVDPYYVACEPHTRSEVSIPLKSGNEVFGVLSIDHTETDAFTEEQLLILQALAGHVAIAIENARVFERERRERRRMQDEAKEARAVQEALFPRAYPLVPGFAFEAAWHPAGAVAGDWFDFIDLGEDRWGIVLADVSGKGTPAALLMSATRAVVRSLAREHVSPGEVLTHVNRAVSEDFPLGKFVTMIYGVLNARTRQLIFASAGHPAPLLVNGNASYVPVEQGLPLGLGASSYADHVISLDRGTQILLYSDGISEAWNERYEEFGHVRLMAHFGAPGASVDGLIDAVRAFCGGKYSDDATAVLIRGR